MSPDGREPIRVLHVEDDLEFADLAGTFLEREHPAMAVETAEGAEEGLAALAESDGGYDCVVSDYDMAGTDGLEFLAAVRERYPDLPFVLFTGKGSEEIASEAISAGVTDYLQKSSDTDQYAVLANRVENAVEKRRAERRLREGRRRYELLAHASTDEFWVWDLETGTVDRSDGYAGLFGYDEDEIRDDSAWVRERIHPEDRERVVEAIEDTVERGEEVYEAGYRFENADGSYSHVIDRGYVVFEEGEPSQVVGAVTDVTDSKRRERELRAVRSTLELVLDGTNTGVWEWTPETDELEWDEAIERLLGVPGDDFDGTYADFRDRVHEADRDRVDRSIARALDGGRRFSEEFRVSHVEGGLRWVAVEGIVRRGDGEDGERLVGLLRDVTERKEREERLRRSERRFEAVFNDPSVFLVLLDADGTVRLANRTAREFLIGGEGGRGADGQRAGGADGGGERREGSAREEASIAGRRFDETRWFQQIESERREEVETAVEDATAGAFARVDGLPIAADDRTLTVDLRLRPVTDDAGDVVSVLFEGVDVSDRQERKRRVEAIHEATRDLVRAHDAEGVASVVAEAAEEILECPSNVVRLLDDGRLRPVTVSERALAELGERPVYDADEGMPGRAFQRGGPVLVDDFEDLDEFDLTPAPNRSGLYVPIGDHGVLSMGDTEPEAFDRSDVHLAGLLASNAAVVLDRLEGERTLRHRERELARQNERLEEFAGVVAHDLRNPLNVAALATNLLPDDEPGVDRLENALDRMETIVDEVLTLAKQGQAVDDPEAVDVGAVAEQAWSTTETEGAELSVEAPPTIEADPDRLRAMLENLFRNAVEHGTADEGTPGGVDAGAPEPASSAGTAEEVVTRGRGRDPPSDDRGGTGVTVSVGSTADDDGFYVEDDGPGIPPEERERVLEPGFSTADEGTGFGLAIVAEIATAHGWRVEVAEADDGGARIEVVTEPGS